MSALLECRRIRKAFDNFVVVHDVDLAVGRREIVGVIGANGAGKTTLVNIISGYLKPTSGTVRLAGEDVTGLPPRIVAKKGVARSFQIPQLFDNLTALENVLIGLTLARDTKLQRLVRFATPARIRAAIEVLEQFGITEYADRLTGTLPQGVRKLLDIALAMSGAPQLVLLDEPTSGVSMEEKHALMTTLWTAFRENATTVIFVEHDMELIERYADRVVAFYEGKIIADGSPDAVLSSERVNTHVTGSHMVRRGA